MNCDQLNNMSQKKVNSDVYNGIEELELLDSANNYTYSIVKEIKHFFDKQKLSLDFGAGAGTYAKRLKKQNYKIECIEIDPTLIKILETNDLKVHNGLDSFQESSLPQIYSINVLEHIEDDLEILKKFYSLLEPGGKLYLYLPAFPILYSRFDKKIGHYRRYKKKDLTEKLIKAGFHIDRIGYKDSIGFFAALVFKLILNSETVSKNSISIYDKLIFPFSKILDPILGRLFGKNVEALIIKK